MQRISSSIARLSGLTFVVVSTMLATGAFAQTVDPEADEHPVDETAFQESERITAIDLLVDVYPKLSNGVVDPSWNRLPEDLIPEDFEIEDRGETRTPITVATHTDEPWRLVVYVDQHLSSTASIRRASSLLAAQAAKLAELGTVEVVAGTPKLRQRLAPTEDAELISSSLSQIALQGEADDRLRTLRAEFLQQGADPDLAVTPAELAAAYAAEETRLVQEGLDDLLLRLLDVGAPQDRKALFVLTDGFDLDPEAFYGEPSPEGRSGLAATYEAFHRAVASYGWVVVPIRVPLVYKYPDSIGPRRALLMKIDRNRNPERAEALLELAQTQIRRELWSEAEKTLGDAIHRFYDHPKTRTRQAVAESLLAETLSKQGRFQDAELALRRAVLLDPTLAETHRGATAGLENPEQPLQEIAAASAGSVAKDQAALVEVLNSLERRIRLTYQIPGAPDGELYPVSVRIDRLGYGTRGAAWVRSATPEAVAAARARTRMRTFESQHDDTLAAEAKRGPEGLHLQVELPKIESDLPVGPFRLTVAIDGPDMLPKVTHRRVGDSENSAIGTVEFTTPLPELAEWFTVLVEDLSSGERHQAFGATP